MFSYFFIGFLLYLLFSAFVLFVVVVVECHPGSLQQNLTDHGVNQ